MERLGFTGSKADNSLFVKSIGANKIFIFVYIDDILITNSSNAILDSTISALGNEFSVHDLGNLNYFLGVEIISQPKCYHLSQQLYNSELLKSTNLVESNKCLTLLGITPSFSKVVGNILAHSDKCRKIARALQYLNLT